VALHRSLGHCNRATLGPLRRSTTFGLGLLLLLRKNGAMYRHAPRHARRSRSLVRRRCVLLLSMHALRSVNRQRAIFVLVKSVFTSLAMGAATCTTTKTSKLFDRSSPFVRSSSITQRRWTPGSSRSSKHDTKTASSDNDDNIN